jgi:hypothetical protein
MEWIHVPETARQAACYSKPDDNLLVVQRAPTVWDAYHLEDAGIDTSTFASAALAMAWCDARVGYATL